MFDGRRKKTETTEGTETLYQTKRLRIISSCNCSAKWDWEITKAS